MTTPLRILLLGFGNVARSFLPLLASRTLWLERTFAIHPHICAIGSRSKGFFLSSEGISSPELLADTPAALRQLQSSGISYPDAETLIGAAQKAGATLLIELTTLNPQNGEPALSHIRTALQANMDVITANKGPIAYSLAELRTLAKQHHRQLRFESTVMDGFPLINLNECTLQAVGMRSFRALLNTTSSLVLSLIEQGASLDEAIEQAQRMGIAEANPWYDLDGWDAAMKTTILANTFFDADITPQAVQRTGIRDLTIEQIRQAGQDGTPWRLVSQVTSSHGTLQAAVRPEPISADDMLRLATGTTSVISLETEAMGTMTFIEHEPEVIQTAYGVLSDLITILRHHASRASQID